MPVQMKMENLEKFVTDFGKVYPPNIPLNIGLSGVAAKFLDVKFVKVFSRNEVKTAIARNFEQPSKYLVKDSKVPQKYKMCLVDSELVRYRRICSEKSFFDKNVDCLFQELLVAGYNKCEINAKIEKAKERIRKKENSDNEQGEEDADCEIEKLYGTMTIHNEVSQAHKVVRETLKSSLGKRKVSLPMTVPHKKLKTYIYTKSKMQERIKSYQESKNF